MCLCISFGMNSVLQNNRINMSEYKSPIYFSFIFFALNGNEANLYTLSIISSAKISIVHHHFLSLSHDTKTLYLVYAVQYIPRIGA